MRILHVSPYYEQAWAYGGIPRVVGALAGGLARRGHEITVCCTDAHDLHSRLTSPAKGRRGAWPPTRTPDGVLLRVFPNVSNRLAYRLQFFVPLGLERFLREHSGAFDMAHLHGCHNLPAAMAAQHLRRAGVPYVLAPHGTAPRIERRRLAKYLFDCTWGRGLLPHASRILAVTDAERRQLLALGADPERIRIVPNPVDLSEFDPPPARERFRARHGMGREPIVLFLGKLTPRKGVDVLLRAFAALGRRDVRLVIAGNDMGHGTTLRRLAQHLDVTGMTAFCGLLTGRDRLEALADADVVAYPSKDEIFGLVPVEALLCGTPVIVADDSGCGEVIRLIGGGQIVPQGDALALAAAIRNALDAPGRWRAEVEPAQARIRQLFSVHAVCARTEEVYAEVAPAAARARLRSVP